MFDAREAQLAGVGNRSRHRLLIRINRTDHTALSWMGGGLPCAVGRDGMPWFERQRVLLFSNVIATARRELEGARTLNPHVIVEDRT